ncbi:MAG: hypothetical protein AB8G11_20675 [Saprospiraceae bacterium]
MDLVTLTNTVYILTKKVFTSEVGRKIKDDFKGAFSGTAIELWEKISPIFIEVIEDEEKPSKAVKNLRKDENDAEAEKRIKGKIENELYENDDLKAQIEAILEKAKQEGDEETKGIIINNSKKFFTGGVSGGTIVFGDYHGEKKD